MIPTSAHLFLGFHKHSLNIKSNTMRHPQLLLLFSIVLISLAASTTLTLAVPVPLADHDAKPDNQTVYGASKLLCWGCLGEALEFLYAHNLVRASHWELPLAWDAQLESYARWWAGQRRGDCKPQHSFPEGGFTLGENIFWGPGSSWAPSDAVAAWAVEERYYSYAANSCRDGEVCGHYTQVVWRSTRRLGCARVVCDGGDVFITCNYDPPGNYVGQRPY